MAFSLDTKAQKLNTMAHFPLLVGSSVLMPETTRTITNDWTFSIPHVEVIENPNKWNKFFTLSSGANVNNTAYTQLPNQSEPQALSHIRFESGLAGVSGGLMMGLENASGYRIFAGVNYHYTASRYSNHEFLSEISTSPGINSVDIDAFGIETPQLGDVVTESRTQFNIDWYNENHLVDITLGVGKVWLSRNGFSLSTDVGVNYNLLSKSTGYSFNTLGNGIEKFVFGEENAFRRNRGIGVLVKGHLSKSITDHLQINVSPFYNHYLNNIYRESSFTAKNSQVGLQLGITFRPGWE